MNGAHTHEHRVPVSWGSPRFRTRVVGPFEITDAFFPPNGALAAHRHGRTVVAVTLSGAIESRLRGRSLVGRPDDVWTEPIGESHANRVGPDGARVLVIQPDPAREDLLEPCRSLLDGVHHFRHGGVAHLGRLLLPELEPLDGVDELMVEGLVLQMLGLGARTSSVRDRGTWFDHAVQILHDGFLDRRTVAAIAGEVGLHPSYFARAFKARAGVTVGQYVRRLRLDWAAHQLRTTAEPIGLIAIRARFADQSHFTREFRRYAGVTPGCYRRSFDA